MTDIYHVKAIGHKDKIDVSVPGSKSITNRALLLAAAGNRTCVINGAQFGDDTRAFLDCLDALGFKVIQDVAKKTVTVEGTGGVIPNRHATINVNSAGTAARFLTVMLAAAGGDYVIDASPQMRRRPMAQLIDALRDAGVEILCPEREGHFPLEIRSGGFASREITIDTTVSSQYASALLLSAPQSGGMKITLTGDRTDGSYIMITLEMMSRFGINVEKKGRDLIVSGAEYGISEYTVEPDASAACYFYAMAPVLKSDVTVRGLHRNAIQGDIRFTDVLKSIGCKIQESTEGLHVDGRNLKSFHGVDVDMKDFSDQTMTMAAVAVFADSPTRIRDIGHIRYQESDRALAIVTELEKMGIRAQILEEGSGTDLLIDPGTVKPAVIDTHNDHRMAMAFTIPGLAVNGISIANPECCRKTFENYFEIIDRISGK